MKNELPSLFKAVEVNERQVQIWRSHNAKIERIHPTKVTYPELMFELRKSELLELVRLLDKHKEIYDKTK